jgi:hypothetical protein
MSERYIYRSAEEERQFEASYLNPEKAHVRAKEVLADSEIKPEIFAGLYGADILKRDAEKVERLSETFEHGPSDMYGEILEAIVCEHGELSDWFGSNSQVIKASRFDDIVNKIDFIVETEAENNQFSHLALGVDVTFGTTKLQKKLAAIKTHIDTGELGQVKYFHSDRQNFTGRLTKIPQVVAGVEIERVKEIGLLWMNRRNKELHEHPIQVTILEEAALQLETFAAYAKSIGKDDTASILERELQKVRELLKEKRKAGLKSIKNDKVFEEIKRCLVLFKKG